MTCERREWQNRDEIVALAQASPRTKRRERMQLLSDPVTFCPARIFAPNREWYVNFGGGKDFNVSLQAYFIIDTCRQGSVNSYKA